jgi:hypothetical protein
MAASTNLGVVVRRLIFKFRWPIGVSLRSSILARLADSIFAIAVWMPDQGLTFLTIKLSWLLIRWIGANGARLLLAFLSRPTSAQNQHNKRQHAPSTAISSKTSSVRTMINTFAFLAL